MGYRSFPMFPIDVSRTEYPMLRLLPTPHFSTHSQLDNTASCHEGRKPENEQKRAFVRRVEGVFELVRDGDLRDTVWPVLPPNREGGA